MPSLQCSPAQLLCGCRELNVLALKPWIDLDLPESIDTALTDVCFSLFCQFTHNQSCMMIVCWLGIRKSIQLGENE